MQLKETPLIITIKKQENICSPKYLAKMLRLLKRLYLLSHLKVYLNFVGIACWYISVNVAVILRTTGHLNDSKVELSENRTWRSVSILDCSYHWDLKLFMHGSKFSWNMGGSLLVCISPYLFILIQSSNNYEQFNIIISVAFQKN